MSVRPKATEAYPATRTPLRRRSAKARIARTRGSWAMKEGKFDSAADIPSHVTTRSAASATIHVERERKMTLIAWHVAKMAQRPASRIKGQRGGRLVDGKRSLHGTAAPAIH